MQDFAERIAAERPALMRTAQRLVRNKAWAEDAVSETLLAALERPSAFAGASSLRTWLVAVLKHKIVDQLRRHTREWSGDPHSVALGTGEAARVPLADADHVHAAWGDPQESVDRLQFIARLGECLQTMPSRQARAFILRNGLEQETAEICDQMGVTANNLAVLLHRANRRLRESLGAAWAPVRAQASPLASGG